MGKILKNFYHYYIDSFKGLSKEVWWLALITFVNRAGTMVIPFMSLYLTENEGFSLSNVGWVMTSFGLGSMVGTWLGGRLTDKIGCYKIMVFSLLSTGIGFILLQYFHGLLAICLAIGVIMMLADTFRPAMFVALGSYSKPENKTRSVTLIRLAINLGFAGGPAVGGMIITTLGYNGLFWVDGITCIFAVILLMAVLNPKKVTTIDQIVNDNPLPVYTDVRFGVFFLSMICYSFIFLQLFSTIPIYFKQKYLLDEYQIGLLMALNGGIIFILEMPVIKYLEDIKISKYSLIIVGAIITVATYVLFNSFYWVYIPLITTIVITIGEMIALPFGNSMAYDFANRGNPGQYMAAYSLSFSVSHVFSHNISMHFADSYGFEFTWWIITGIGLLCISLLSFSKIKWNM